MTTASRSRAVQMAVVPLLLILAGIWLMRARPSLPTAPPLRPVVAPPPAAVDHWEGPRTAAPLALPTRDPFQPPPAVASRLAAASPQPTDSSPTNPSPVRLQGIIWGAATPRAILNDRIVGVGESVEGVQVIAIAPEGVTIDYQGQRAVLHVTTSSSPSAYGSR